MNAGFWAIPDTATIKTPAALLKEQAGLLTDATKGLLKGEVSSGGKEEQVFQYLYIITPALAGFRYHVLTFRHPITLYPGAIFIPYEDKWYFVDDEAKFIAMLQQVLGSENTRNAISGLLAQALEKS